MANIFKAKTLVSRTGIFSHEVIAPNLVYNTGDQTISGVKTFATGVNISGHVGIGINNNDKFGLYVRKSAAGVSVNPDSNSIAVFEGSGNSHITVLASDAQTAGVVLGSPADNFGSYLTWNYDNNELKLGTDKAGGFISLLTDDELPAVRITSGRNVGIGTISPSEKLQVVGNILANNLVYNTGDQNISGIKTFIDNINVSGTGVFNAIDLNNIDTLNLSGVDISITSGNVNLTNRPNVNGVGVVLSGELNSTGIFLNNRINSLSGYVNYSLNNIVYTTGNQTISGIKTFAENSVFGDPSQGDFLVISGNNFTVYGSGNFTSGLFVNGNAVLTGVNLSSTNSDIVYTTGIQNIIARKGIGSISGNGGFSNPYLGLEIVTRDNMFIPTFGAGYGGEINIVGGSGLSLGGSINLYAGAQANELYGGNINTRGNLEINKNAGFNRTINIYKTGVVFGVTSSFPSITIDQNSVSINSPMVGAAAGTAGVGLYISGVGVTPALYVNTTSDQIINGLKTFTSGIDIYSGASPQSLRIFNSTGTNSGEFALIGWQRNVGIVSPTTNGLVIGTQSSNSGTLRDLIITGNNIALYPNSAGRLYINGTASLNDYLLQTSQCSGNITGFITGLGFTGNYTGNYEGGYFLGRTKITQNTVQLLDSSFGSNFIRKSTNAPSERFRSIAVSSDGRYQITAVGDYGATNGYVYVSNDYGNTWTPRITDTTRAWRGIAISADGKYQTACHHGGFIYVSNDYGNTWTAKDSTRYWGAVAMSSDGKYQSAVGGSGSSFSTGIYVSNDYGNTWILKSAVTTHVSITMSSDGKYQYAVENNSTSSSIYRSFDYGNTWTSSLSAAPIYTSIATSADGKFIIIGRTDSTLLISNNYGASFATKSISTYYFSVAVSDNGKYMVAGAGAYFVTVGGIYFSSDYGNTWRVITPSGQVWAVAMSSNAKYVIAASSSSSTPIHIFKTDELIDGNLTINNNLTLPSGDFYSYNATGVNSGEFGLIGWRNNQFVIGSQQSQSGILRDVLITGNNININGSGVLNIFDSTNIVGNLTVTGNATITNTGVFRASNINYTPLLSNPLSVIGSGNTFVQLNIQNLAIGDAASSDLVLTSNAGTDDSFYLDLGINNSGYNQAAYNIGNSGDGYLYVHGGNLTIGTQSPNRTIKFHTDGTTSANQIAEINSTGYFSPNKSVTALSGFFGRNNTGIGTDIAMGGGENNRISGNESVIAGGFNNNITGDFSNINGGCFNLINGNTNTIAGGTRNTIAFESSSRCYTSTTLNNFIGGGCGNYISANQCNNVIVGGVNNRFCSFNAGFVKLENNSILGGADNFMSSACFNTILGGSCNSAGGCYTSIVGGFCNNMSHACSTIAYGVCNTGEAIAGGIGPIFVGGDRNRINSSYASAVFGGCDNKMYGSCSSIVGGHSNTIGTWSNRVSPGGFIGGGGFNTITGTETSCSTTSEYSLIVGGYANKVTSCYGSILGGRQNLVTHIGATVIGDGAPRDKISRGTCSLSLDFNGGIFLTGSNITLSPSPLPGRVDFCNSNLINATPNILNVNSNFSIGTGYNSRVVLANSGSMLTGTINLGNPTGFNSSIIQIGVGQVQITGAAGVIIQTYNNQFKTAGQYATISLLHSGNNGYIMYGNTV